MRKYNTGFTLVELLITVLIIGVLVSVAVPSYQEYVGETCLGVGEMNMKTMVPAQENYFMETNSYLAGERLVDGDNNITSDTLGGPLHWEANDKNSFNYVVTAGAGGISKSAVITVTKDDCVGASSITLTKN